jgi:hypothetical protein
VPVPRDHAQEYFNDYDGKNEFEPAARFIEQKFLAKNKNPSKMVYVHITYARGSLFRALCVCLAVRLRGVRRAPILHFISDRVFGWCPGMAAARRTRPT